MESQRFEVQHVTRLGYFPRWKRNNPPLGRVKGSGKCRKDRKNKTGDHHLALKHWCHVWLRRRSQYILDMTRRIDFLSPKLESKYACFARIVPSSLREYNSIDTSRVEKSDEIQTSPQCLSPGVKVEKFVLYNRHQQGLYCDIKKERRDAYLERRARTRMITGSYPRVFSSKFSIDQPSLHE